MSTLENIPLINGLILAGGKSTRMGQDKAALVYDGRTQLARAVGTLKIFTPNFFISCREEQRTFVQKILGEVNFITDKKEFVHIGPLGGILSAQSAFVHEAWLVLACDLPFVTEETLNFLIQNRDAQKVATAYRSTYDGLPEPLCAIWEPRSLAITQDFFKKGIQCPRKILKNSDTHLLEPPNKHWLDNVNTPEEFKKAQEELNR